MKPPSPSHTEPEMSSEEKVKFKTIRNISQKLLAAETQNISQQKNRILSKKNDQNYHSHKN